MGSRAELAAEAKEKHLGALRLQEKFNCVRQYQGLGANQEDFCNDSGSSEAWCSPRFV